MDQGFERIDATIGKTPRRARTGRRWTLFAGLGFFVGLLAAIGGYLVWVHSPPPLVDTLPPASLDTKLGEVQALVAELGEAPQAGFRWLDPKTNVNDAADLETAIPQREARLAQLSRLMLQHAPYPTHAPYLPHWEVRPYTQTRAWLIAGIKRSFYQRNWAAGLRQCLDLIEIGGKVARKGYGGPHVDGLKTALLGACMIEAFVPHLSAVEAKVCGRQLERILAAFPTRSELAPAQRAGRMNDVRTWLSDDWTYYEWTLTWKTELPGKIRLGLVAFFKRFYPRPVVYAQVDAFAMARALELEKPYSQRQYPAPLTEPLARQFLSTWEGEEHGHLPACLAQLRLVRLELALQEYRRGTGSYPSSLAALSERLSPAFLTDPLSGKPMAYRFPRPWSSPPARFPYLLYSYGLDREDGGGRTCVSRCYDNRPGRDLVAGEVPLR